MEVTVRMLTNHAGADGSYKRGDLATFAAAECKAKAEAGRVEFQSEEDRAKVMGKGASSAGAPPAKSTTKKAASKKG